MMDVTISRRVRASAFAGALALSACSGGSDQRTVVEACVASGARADICKCAAKKLKANLTDADYDAYVVIAKKLIAAKKAGKDEVDVMLEISAGFEGDFEKLGQMNRIGQTSEAAMLGCQR